MKKDSKKKKAYYNAENVLLCLYSFIKKYEMLPNNQYLNLSKQNRQYYLNQLKKLNLVKKIGKGVWIINKEYQEEKIVKKIIVTTKTNKKENKIIRGHGHQLVMRLPKFEYWHKLKVYLDKKKIPYTITGKNNIRIVNNDIIFHICKNSVVFYYPTGWNFLANSGAGCDALALGKANEVLDQFRAYLGIDFRIKGEYKVNITRSHKAWVSNEFAKKIHSKGKSIMIRGKDGKVWLITDKSFKFDELEFIDAKESTRDIDNIFTPFYNKIREDPNMLDNLIEENKKIKELIKEQQGVISILAKREERSINLDRFKY